MRVPIVITCLLMFGAFVTVDLLTPQHLVVAILLNIPIALSGLAFSNRFTLVLAMGAIAANVLAGWLNALHGGGADSVSLWNRALLAASFILVGGMTINLSRTSSRLGALRIEEARARRERDRERVLAAVGVERSLTGALQRTAESLTAALEARGVVFASSDAERFTRPRVAHPANLVAWPVNTSLPSGLVGTGPTGLTVTEHPAEFGLTANRALITGLGWGGRTPLLLAVLDPGADAAATLEDLCPLLGAALERIELNERLEIGRLELERRSAVIRDLVYAFSHDLRTPITANVVNMKLALEGAYGSFPDEYRKALENGILANEDLLSLADELLLVARYEGSEARTMTETLALAQEAKRVSARLENAMRERQVVLEWHLVNIGIVRGDAGDLRRTVQNLLENAVKWSPQGGTVEVRLEAVGQRVRLEVADRGPGVPTDLEPRLFTRFTGSRAGGGSGLGLYLSKRIIEAHGGQIGYRPRPGGGSLFWFELPMAKNTAREGVLT